LGVILRQQIRYCKTREDMAGLVGPVFQRDQEVDPGTERVVIPPVAGREREVIELDRHGTLRIAQMAPVRGWDVAEPSVEQLLADGFHEMR
jgi:hypothetical protein